MRQKGFALLTVLLVVALVSMVASQLLYEQQVHIKRSGYMIHQAQALSASFGYESWVKKSLKADMQSSQVDHLNEAWAQPLHPVAFADGTLSGHLLDMQSRLNLNNVMVNGAKSRQFWQKVIERYLVQNLASANENLELAGFGAVLQDWVDRDDMAAENGAESEYYLLKKPAYRSANQPLVMLSELKQLKGMQSLTAQDFRSMQQHLATLPEVSEININTAKRAVLLALTDWMTEPLVDGWLQQRQLQPAQSVAMFYQYLQQTTGFASNELKQSLPEKYLTVQSRYFLLQSQFDFGEVKQGVNAIFKRNEEQKIFLVQRWLSVG